jgi:hypothetical protein
VERLDEKLRARLPVSRPLLLTGRLTLAPPETLKDRVLLLGAD